MRYDKFSYVWPARPEKAIPVNFINVYKRKGWVAQYKKNGTCNVLFVSPEGEVINMNRHGEEHRGWKPTNVSNSPFIEATKGEGWWVFLTEVLNNKVSGGPKDTHYIFDVMVADGEYLTGETFEDRISMLEDIFLNGGEKETDSHYIITPNVWLAKTVKNDFKHVWNEINNSVGEGAPMNEGLVFKNPKAKLELPFKETSNNGWMVKCRVSHKNYNF